MAEKAAYAQGTTTTTLFSPYKMGKFSLSHKTQKIHFFIFLINMYITKRFGSIILRLLAIGSTLSAAIIMAISREKVNFFSVSLEAKYSNMHAFKYFVAANTIVSGYSLLILFVPPKSLFERVVIALDVVMSMFLTSSISAALAVAQIGRKGNSSAGWLPICGQVPKYCDHVTISLVLGFIGAVICVLHLLYSIYSALYSFHMEKM